MDEAHGLVAQEGETDVVTSVTAAFEQFRCEHVDLDVADVATARKSRDFLQRQISSLLAKGELLPKLDATSAQFVASGSFARSTKIRPLDDVDFFMVLDPSGVGNRQSLWDEHLFYLIPKSNSGSPLAGLTDDRGHISSTRVLNQLKRMLASVPSYSSSDIHRNGEAVSLRLASHPWKFDLVPTIPHVSWWTGRVDWYLMPNGTGNWMRADPRRDAKSATAANQSHADQLLPLVRLVKYWNTKRLRQGLSSYYIETLCLKVFEYPVRFATLQQGLETFFRRAPLLVQARCPDPKHFGPRLDQDVNRRTKGLVRDAMREAARVARTARKAERMGDVKAALECWRRIFGPGFPC